LCNTLDVIEKGCYTVIGAIEDIGHLIDVQDVVEWEEDEDEYVRKNLPSELVGFSLSSLRHTMICDVLSSYAVW
jgi:hypothetical protein